MPPSVAANINECTRFQEEPCPPFSTRLTSEDDPSPDFPSAAPPIFDSRPAFVNLKRTESDYISHYHTIN